MNLERIALMRAEEQVRAHGREMPPEPVRPVVSSRPPRKRLHLVPCVCGACLKCRNREWMRAYREKNRHPRAGHVGPYFDLGRKCERCREPIADKNQTGFCKDCQTTAAYRRHRGQFYSSGGGI